VIDNFVSSLEIFPTVLEITGLKKPEDVVLDGFSMVPLLTGEDNNLERTEMYWEFREEYAARVGDWKWLRSDRRNHKGLYDLATDVGEKTDLSETNMEQNRIMEEKFAQWQQAMNEAEPRGPFKDY
jgi:arylsulfatase A-like enzyme